MKEFKKIWFNKIVSTKGFVIKYINKDCFIYIENTRTLIPNTEMLNNGNILLYRDSIRKWSNNNEEEISNNKQEEILFNIKNALQYDHRKLDII